MSMDPADTAENTQQDSDWQAERETLLARISELEELAALREEAHRDSLALAAGKYREALIAASPHIPADMIKGETVEQIEASLASARELVARVRAAIEAESRSAAVPAGAPVRGAQDLSDLSPAAKIALGLQRSGAGTSHQ
ncbi:MAG: hypothetical protein IBX68_12735 [Dehalococcoidia bacterium]|nr:hypothetical protein [Dehalococcoidia bacterium]